MSSLLAQRIPDHYHRLIDWADPADPLRLMVEFSQKEQHGKSYELPDPIGDSIREIVPGLIHRYPNRCLLLLTTYCPIHCRFCFRRDVVGTVRPVDITRIVAYLTAHTEISEIIFSGGDPFTFPLGFFEHIKTLLLPLDHLKRWRFHTRVPVADPQRITPAFLTALATANRQITVVMHINHPRELSPETLELINALRQRQVLVLSQSVLLKGVNGSVDTLTTLFESLYNSGVKPYQLHHLDVAPGTHHFRISLESGRQLVTALRGRLSGPATPEYMLDLPGGFGKVPVFSLEKVGDNRYQAISFEGTPIIYEDPA